MTKGMYGEFGGQYAPETLMIALEELETAYEQLKEDPDFQQEAAVLFAGICKPPISAVLCKENE